MFTKRNIQLLTIQNYSYQYNMEFVRSYWTHKSTEEVIPFYLKYQEKNSFLFYSLVKWEGFFLLLVAQGKNFPIFAFIICSLGSCYIILDLSWTSEFLK